MGGWGGERTYPPTSQPPSVHPQLLSPYINPLKNFQILSLAGNVILYASALGLFPILNWFKGRTTSVA